MALQVIRGDLLGQIEACIDRFVKQTKVKCALVADKSGQLITQVGFTASLDLRSLAALVSGIFVSGEELARLLGESHFVVLYHEGRHMSIFFTLVASEYIFVSIFDDRTNMGVVQLYAKDVKDELAPLMAAGEAEALAENPGRGAAADKEAADAVIDEEGLEAFFSQDMSGDEEEAVEGPEDAFELKDPIKVPVAEARPSRPPVEEKKATKSGGALGHESLDDLFGFGEEKETSSGDELSRLFDQIASEESDAPSDKNAVDQKSLREGLDDLFNL